MKRSFSVDGLNLVGQDILVKGWVQSRRDHGGLIFIDLRDHQGIIQLVINPEKDEAFKIAEKIRDEFVIQASGLVRNRENSLVNPKLETGKIEILINELKILSKSDPLPIAIFQENTSNEEQRFKYRYLDLRSPKSQNILKRRAEYYKVLRNFMEKNDFTEVTTPILGVSSPEGARDFLVPSRVHPGKFYALPQSPQQFKQLLMIGGLYRYYQIAPCFRDEDPRADRLYGDFYHLDLEMSFVENGEEVRNTVEPLIKDLVINFAAKKLLSEETAILSYQEAIENYGSDKPDLRFDLKLINVNDCFKNTNFEVFKNALQSGGIIKAIKVVNGSKLSRSQIDHYTDLAKEEGAKGLAYILKEGNELRSPITKFLSEEEINLITQKMELSDGDLIFFGADKAEIVHKVLGKLRNEIATDLNLKDNSIVSLVWVVDFPYYEWDETNQKIDFGHNPFSMPKGGLEALSTDNLLAVSADQYDMVMNGYEICSGAIRNHDPQIMYKAFENIGYSKEVVDQKFGAMVNAFRYGAPPHGGCAFGVDRILMILIDEPNIREIMAFPKNGSGVDLMMNSPSAVDDKQLKELGLRTIF